MDQDFYFEEANPHKTKRIIIFLIILFLALAVLFLYYRSRYTLNIRKDLKFEAGSVLSQDVRDFVLNKVVDQNDYTLMLSGVQMEDNVLTSVGEYTFKIKYKNITKSGKIKVIDTVAPKVEVKDVTVGLDEEFEPSEFISVCEDYSKPCNVEYVSEESEELYKKEGSYNLKIRVSDSVGNSVKKDVNLTVKKDYSLLASKENDLTVHHIDPDYSDWDNSIVLKFSKALDPNDIDETDEYGQLMEISGGDLHNYIDPMYINNLITDSQIIEVYNKYGLVIGYAIRIKLDNGLYLYLKK